MNDEIQKELEIKKEIEELKKVAGIPIPLSPLVSDDDIDLVIRDFVSEQFFSEFDDVNDDSFDIAWSNYKKIDCFPALGNVYDEGDKIDPHTHFVMRSVAAWHIERALKALKFDTDNDPNLKSDDKFANIGTAGRIAKIWGGKTLDPENIREYGDGRWTKEPRLAAFPATDNDKDKPVTVVIDNPGIGSVCSHHFLPYGITKDINSKIIISYIPEEKLLGLSKIGRYVEWCMNRPSLQEEVTNLIYKKISKIAGTDSVYVGLIELSHSCETTRGAKQYSTTTTESFGGKFDDIQYRNSLINRHIS